MIDPLAIAGKSLSAVARVLYSAAALQQAHVTPTDSVLVESPLPAGAAAVARFFLNSLPTWAQIGGAAVGAILAAVLLRYLFVRRSAIRVWVGSRKRGVRVALAITGALVLILVGGAGAVTWNYTQHSNDFCTGCHIMKPAFQRFMSADNKHNELSCHACHQQSMYASARQVYLWVAERPGEIGEHAKVPNRVCESCHVTGDTAKWQHIRATAGHRVHLESDSSVLRNVQCVTCHGVEVHRFKPVKETCGQTDCHKPSETDIVLGKMAVQTVRHCTACHEFTADVPALATRDSARGTLVPGKPQCFGCHEMQKLLAGFAESRDPHAGKCGSCHKPHTQETPQAAAASCASAGCHANWKTEPFHTGANHRRLGERCLTCHVPHSAKVDASDCQGCHTAVRARSALRPPLQFDTTRALRRSDTTSIPPQPSDEGLAPFVPDDPPPKAHDAADVSALPPPADVDSFPHARHAKLACLECHVTIGRARLTFEQPRGCAICHHKAPAPDACATCHQPAERDTAIVATVTVAVRDRAARSRPVDFLHARHETRACTECHTTAVTLATAPTKAQCIDCHAEHHEAASGCASCHALATPKAEHRTLEAAHQRCDACHARATVARLTPNRAFCATCHVPQANDHYPRRECTVCHFLTEPGQYRGKLLSESR